jgi:protein TonB
MNTLQMNHFEGKKFSGLAVVITLHLILGFGLINGLKNKTIKIPEAIKDITIIKTKSPPLKVETSVIKVNIKEPTFKPFIKLPEIVIQNNVKNDTIIKDFTNDEHPPVINKGTDTQDKTLVNDHASKGSVIKQAVVNFNSCSKPEYPANSIRDGETGKVGLQFLIGKDGHVINSRVLSSSGYRNLDKAAQRGLSACQFTPGTVDGVSQESVATVEYVWKLD